MKATTRNRDSAVISCAYRRYVIEPIAFSSPRHRPLFSYNLFAWRIGLGGALRRRQHLTLQVAALNIGPVSSITGGALSNSLVTFVKPFGMQPAAGTLEAENVGASPISPRRQ